MKTKFFFIAILAIFVSLQSCKNDNTNNTDTNNQDSTENTVKNDIPDAKVQVIYFHATNRCATCNAVENIASELIQEHYKEEYDEGIIYFKSLNLEEPQNEELVNKYEIAFSTLLIITYEDGEEIVTDFTDTAFRYAKNQPDEYKELLKVELEKVL